MSFINFTPHAIVVRTEGGDVSIPPSGIIIRLFSAVPELVFREDGIEIFSSSFLPDYPIIGLEDARASLKSGDREIISLAVAVASFELQGFGWVRPRTGPTDNPIRDEKVQIVAITRFVLV